MMLFWLQKLQLNLSNGKGFIHINHTVRLGMFRYLIFSSCGPDNITTIFLKTSTNSKIQLLARVPSGE